MEESSEAHMETDVSSTTADVPEIQEVTGSQNRIETVVVVEEIKEERNLEVDLKTQDARQRTLQDDKKSVSNEPSQSFDKSLQKNIEKLPNKDGQTQKSPIKDGKSQSSPAKDVPVQKSSVKEGQPINSSQKTPTKHDQVHKSSNIMVSPTNKAVQPPTELQHQKENADSSSTGVQNTPTKLTEKSLQKLPPTTSEAQKTKSPQKETTHKSPVKENQIQDNTKITPMKPSQAPITSNEGDNNEIHGSNEVDSSKQDEEITSVSLDITCEIEASNDSQMETNSDISEKEHNKSISRELKSLINSAKESKIISECTQLTSKTRKSRSALDSSNTSLNTSVEADKIQGRRRGSNISLKSNSSEKSEKATLKRSMRSQNPEFVNKVKQFLNSVTGKGQKHELGEIHLSDEEVEEINKNDEPNNSINTPKRKKPEPLVQEKGNKLRSDLYCWRCHWALEQTTNEKAPHPTMHCTVCPRSYHYKCLSGSERSKTNAEKSWVCSECLTILHAESSETRSQAMKKISLGMLCELLKHALERMMDLNGVEPFMQPVDRAAFPDYDKYVVHPMDLSLMKANIDEGLYGSTEAFLADAQWILHNSIIFNTLQSKLTAGARALVRSCRAEMSEIEACPECYAAAHARRPTWFTDVCSTPHMLLWAKLKGFPYWPAKGMSVSNAGLVDVRFFGAHDRAWVPARDCFLYSERDPNNFRTKRQDILDSMQEAEHHIRNISRKYGKFVYPPFKSQFDPSKLNEQLKMMIPSFEGEVRTTMKEKQSSTSPNMAKEKRSNSKSSKDSFNDGPPNQQVVRETPISHSETSEGDDMTVTSRKMEDGAEIAKEDEDITGDMDKTVDPSQTKESESPKKPSDSKEKDMEVDTPQTKETENSRKRRRSGLEEAVITIMDTAVGEKRKRIEVNIDKVLETKSQTQDTYSSKETEAKPMQQDEEPEKDGTLSKKIEVVKLSSTEQKEKTTPKLTPIKIITIPRTNKQTPKVNTPKDSDKVFVQKTKPARRAKSSSNEKDISQEEKSKRHKQKTTKVNKSSSNNNTPKTDKNVNKKIEIDISFSNNKEKQPQNDASSKETEMNKSIIEKNTSTPKQNTLKSTKDRIQFDDDVTLADIAREAAKTVVPTDTTRLPTISSVRSLSTITQNADTNKTKNTSTPKPPEKIVEASSDSSIFTPTSTDNVRNMKEAVNKLQKLRSDTDQPVVGRVGVRSFARMVSPQHASNTVEVEIKTEPIDFDDADRQVEKMNLMKAFKLRPVNAAGASLRDVRINRVVTTPATRKSPSKPPEVRVRAKKTFPQPKKADEPRSELISKNSMVYIPIQPPMTQAPVKVTSRSQTNGPATPSPVSRPSASVATTTSTSTNSLVNTAAPPLVPVPLSSTLLAPAPISSTLPTVPTTVHTVPLITSVNGQWTFSLQPVMSVGSVDGTPSPPMVNGIAERPNPTSGVLCNVTPGPTVPTVLQPAVPTTTSTATITVPIVSNTTNPTASTSTPAPASAVPNRTSDNAPGEPPRLYQRPLLHPLDANTPIGGIPPPSTAGPITAKLNQNAVKLTDFFRNLLEDSIEKLDEPQAQVTALRSQLEQTRWRHQQEIDEITHNHELVLAEMRMSFEKEKARVVNEVRKTAQAELDTAIKHTKSKQWCANCSQEAQFYCCWNTSYCDYPCQRAHWTQHYAVCTQQRSTDGNNSEGTSGTQESRLQLPPDSLPKSTSTPTLTVGGKVATSRVFGHDSQKTSIIVSMVEDTSGNQLMKCVGTYKPPASPQTSPLIINKQLLNSEEGSAKKVVTSGGYLIVGASGNQTATSVVASTRRPNTIQYFT